ncbi:MAG: metallophosphoesterase [Chloroflexota bacterium]
MIRLAAVSDLHFKSSEIGSVKTRLFGVNDTADLLLLPGDLIDSGTADDARLLVRELEDITLPILAVVGNHEFSAGMIGQVLDIYRQSGIRLLDGDAADFIIRRESIGVVGTRGCRGGFGESALQPTYEPEVSYWLDVAEAEVLKIESGLGSIITDYRVVMTHFSPVRGTLEGEVPEEIPFYGSGMLCEPVDRLGADVIIHGHSHKGQQRGTSPGGIPVYNVAATVIPAPYIIVELGS